MEAIGTGIINGHFSNVELFDYIDCLSNLKLEDVDSRLNDELISKMSAISIVSPMKGD